MLKRHSIASPFLDARLLLEHTCNFNQNQILLEDQTLMLTESQYDCFKEYIIERATKKTPIAKIIHKKEFFGLNFYVDQNVLDPRPDSEILVEMILNDFRNSSDLNILEIATGSACLIIALIKSLINAKATCLDISLEALKVAEKNIINHNLSANISLLKSDLFSNISCDEKFDIIFSNPPYIPTAEIVNLADDVKNHDPIIALDGGMDGLDFYRKIAKEASSYLTQNGSLYLEIGINQFPQIKDIFANENWYFDNYQKDLAGIIRALKFIKK